MMPLHLRSLVRLPISRKRLQSLCLIIPLSTSSTGYATVVDYSALEALFGEPVTTSATGSPQRSSDTALSMEIITAEEIQHSGALDIPQLLRRVAGVEVVRNFRGHADVNIRGFNQPSSNRLLVLVNGRQVYMDNFGITIWHAIPVQLDEIKQIEVVRGPNTSLFGFNAASGVINIITYNPLFDEETAVYARTGSESLREVRGLATVHPTDRVGIRLSAGHLEADGFDIESIPAISRVKGVDAQSINLDSLISLSDTAHLRWTVGFNTQNNDSFFPYNVPVGFLSRSRHYSLTLHKDNTSWGSITTQLYRNETDAKIGNERFLQINSLGGETDNHLTVFQLSTLLSPSADHIIRLGAEYRDNAQEGDDIAVDGSDFSIQVGTINTMWNWSLSPQTTWTSALSLHRWKTDGGGTLPLADSALGISAADYSRQESEFSFNFSLLHQYRENQLVRMSLARGLHIPSLVELARVQQSPNAEVYGNPNLETESNTTFELGFEQQRTGWLQKSRVNLFYQRMEEVIQWSIYDIGVAGGALADYTFENGGDASAYGIEFIFEGESTKAPLSWGANLTYIRQKNDPNDDFTFSLDFEETIPQRRINFYTDYTHNRFSWNLSLHHVSQLDQYTYVAAITPSRQPAEDVNSYTLVNMRFGYLVTPQLTLALEGLNLFDEHAERPAIREYSFFGFPLGTSGANEIDRSVMFSLKYDF